MMVRTTIGGSRIRLKLSNLFGKEPLHLQSVHVGLFPSSAQEPFQTPVVSGTDRSVRFSGAASLTIPPGKTATSDPIDFQLPSEANLAVTIYVSERSPVLTTQYAGRLASYVSSSGDYSARPVLPLGGQRFGTVCWLSGVDVLAPADAGAIVVLSDDTSAVLSDVAWPRLLASRLLSNAATQHAAVVTLADSPGYSFVNAAGQDAPVVKQLEQAVLVQSGIRWIVLAPFVPEIAASARPVMPSPPVSEENITTTFRRLVEEAHSKGVKVAGGTLTPFYGSSIYSPAGEAIRQTVNKWIRASGIFDALIDFDGIVRDLQHPEQLSMEYGGRARRYPLPKLADLIDLSIFSRPPQR